MKFDAVEKFERYTTWSYRFIYATALLAIAVVLVLIAPSFVPDGYSVMRGWISSLASQGTPGAWIAKLGFLCCACGLWLVTTLMGKHWLPRERLLMRIGAFGIMALGIFGHKPWVSGVPFDAVEARLHDVGVGIAGGAFALVMISQASRERRVQSILVWFHRFTMMVAATVLLPMYLMAEYRGLLQRVLFVTVLIWVLLEMRSVWLGRRVLSNKFASHGEPAMHSGD